MPVAAIVGQFGQHGASDAAACECQSGFFFEAQRPRSVQALVGERTTVQAHATPEAARATFDQRSGTGLDEHRSWETFNASVDRPYPAGSYTFRGRTHPKKAMRVLTAEEGAEAHTHVNNFPLLHQVVFDWLDETLTPNDITQRVRLADGA